MKSHGLAYTRVEDALTSVSIEGPQLVGKPLSDPARVVQADSGHSPMPLSQEFVSGLAVITDAVAVVLAAIAVQLAFLVTRGEAASVSIGMFCFASIGMGLTFRVAGLYRFPVLMRPARYLHRLIGYATAVAMGLVAAGFAAHVLDGFSRLWAGSWLVLGIVLIVGFRFTIASLLRRLSISGRIGRRILVYGAGEQAEKLINRIVGMNEPWNRIVGVFDDRRTRVEDSVAGYPVVGGLAELVRRAQLDSPDEVLIALPWGAEDRILEVLHELAVLPCNVRLGPEFLRMDKVHGRTNSQFGFPALSAFEKPVGGWGRVWKRLFDFGLAACAIILAAPILLLIAILIRLESPGPVLFRQRRYGFNNKLINVFKFRTMRSEVSDPLGIRLTERGDDRVTRIGAFLRRTSLDELPQLLNVLRSEMSLVGPRPHAIRTTAGGRQCDEVVDQYAIRHKVKPGITGWAQVNGWRGTMETEEHLIKRLEHDLYYINNWSPLFDIKILFLTVWSVLHGRNSY